MPTRRTFLLGGGVVVAGLLAAGVGVEQGLLPGRPYLQAHLGLDGEDGVIPDIEPGPELEDSFTSSARGGVEVGWSLILPPGSDPAASGSLPLVVALHWHGVDHRSLTGNELGLDRYLAQHVQDGGVPFAIAAPDGGTGYWHPHDGDDAGAMVTDELLPILAQRGFDTSRIGWLGWSMGGYGALRLAALRGFEPTAGVVACSPALWSDPGDASPSGFSDADEYQAYSVFHDQGRLAGIPVRVDIGTGDPFYRDVQDYVAGFPVADVTSSFEPGGHTPGYWRRMLPAQLDFLGQLFPA